VNLRILTALLPLLVACSDGGSAPPRAVPGAVAGDSSGGPGGRSRAGVRDREHTELVLTVEVFPGRTIEVTDRLDATD
jgi:hypothetical protein